MALNPAESYPSEHGMSTQTISIYYAYTKFNKRKTSIGEYRVHYNIYYKHEL
jgi:hypothetical protein